MQLKNYLPLYFQNIREFDAMASAEQPEVNKLVTEINKALANEFIETLDENGCAIWEDMLNITPLDTATLADRRFVILSKYREQLPYTWLSLIARLDTVVGAGNYVLTENTASWTLLLRIALSQKARLAEVTQVIENVVPCNIITVISYLYNRYSTLADYTHGHLAGYTYAQLREDVLS